MRYNRKELLTACRLIGKIVKGRVVQPALACVKLDGGSVTGTDLDNWLTINVFAGERGAQPVITPLKELVARLASLTTAEVTFTREYSLDAEQLLINGLKLESFQAEDYPANYGVKQATARGTIFASSLRQALDQTTWAASDYGTSSMLGCVNITGSDICATDGSRLSHVGIHNGWEVKANIPVAACNVLQSVFAALKIGANDAGLREDELGVIQDADLIEFHGSRFSLTARLNKQEYPRYKELFPDKRDKSLTILDRKAVLAALKTLKPSNDKRTNLISISAEAGTISNKTDRVGVELDCQGSIEPFQVNANYFTQVLESMTQDKVQIRFESAIKPLIFTEHNYRHLLMPIESEEARRARLEGAKATR